MTKIRVCSFPSFVITALKVSVIRSYSGPHFPAFELNRERLFVSFRSQSECEKMRISITPNTDTFYAVNAAYKVSWDSASLRLTCNYQGKISKNVSWVSTLSRTLKIFKVTLISRARETEGKVFWSLQIYVEIFWNLFFSQLHMTGPWLSNMFPNSRYFLCYH